MLPRTTVYVVIFITRFMWYVTLVYHCMYWLLVTPDFLCHLVTVLCIFLHNRQDIYSVLLCKINSAAQSVRPMPLVRICAHLLEPHFLNDRDASCLLPLKHDLAFIRWDGMVECVPQGDVPQGERSLLMHFSMKAAVVILCYVTKVLKNQSCGGRGRQV